MNVFCYFVEPASYSIDLAKNIYQKKDIDFCFIKSYTFAKSAETIKSVYLDKLSILSKLKFIYQKHKKNKLIIVNGYNNLPFFFSFLLNFFKKNKKYIAIESDSQKLKHNFFKHLLKRLILGFIFKNKFVLGFAGGTNTHKQYFKYYGMRKENIFLMPLVIDNLKFYQKTIKKVNKFIFLYVGRIVPQKNIELLIKEFIKYFSQTQAILNIVGSGSELVSLKNKYNLNNINFLGEMHGEDLLNQYSKASCFILPSNFEPWGLVVNEALSSGLPVIISDKVGSGHDLVKGNENGFIISDINDFGVRMVQLFENKDLFYKYSKNATNFMLENWNYNYYDKCFSEAINKIDDF
tara:strand:- start:1136 stop:2185 length:1050 start_codon:yes stop_codon:yes gene_type:complete